ncbi:cytochrome P450 [Ramaria rubella]|nr:cytochrome P450 [Ramaria rubella]
MALTPGLYFLITTLIPVLFGPAILVHALLILFSQFWPSSIVTPITPSTLACIYAFSFPIYGHITSRLYRLKVALAARRLGARVVKRIDGSLPWNIDLLVQGFTASRTDYLGDQVLSGWGSVEGEHTFSVEILGDNRIITMNPRNIQKILATDFDMYCKGSLFNGVMESMLGIGVFNSDGDMWQFHRKMTRPFFSKERVTDLILYERKAAIALQKMQERFDIGYAVNFQDLVSRFTLDSAAEFLLGASVNSIDSPLPLPHNASGSIEQSTFTSTASTRFARAFSAAQVGVLSRMELGNIWPLPEIFGDKMKTPMEEIKGFIDPIVRNAMKKQEFGGIKDEETLLGHLLDVTKDMKVITDETLNILLAGRDTTASLLTFTIYCLAMHPDVLSRLRKEILSSIGSTRSPSYDDLRDMKYLRGVLNETLRLFPPVPFNLRETIGETTLFNNNGEKIYVPPHTRVVLVLLHLHRSEEYWGPDAHIYDPDRWLDSRVQNYTSNPFIFVPFNAGPRICLGQQFAYHETSFFLVRLLQRYDHIELAPECQPPNTRPPHSWQDPSPLNKRRPLEKCFMRSHLTLYADGGLWIRARQAQAETV